MENFSNLYDLVRNLSTEPDAHKKVNKPEVLEHLVNALKALKEANELIKNQSTTIMQVTNELVQQCQESRAARSQANTPSPALIPHTTNSNAAESMPKLILKRTQGSEAIARADIDAKMRESLKNVHVNRTRIIGDDTVIVEFPNQQNCSNAVDNLRREFSNFSVENVKMISPKLTIVNVPLDVANENLIPELCLKDPFIKNCVDDNSDELSIINSWDTKNRSGVVVARKVAIKCSPRLRNYIVNKCNGYVFVDLSRCKVYDRFYVPQCYHCQKFNHYSGSCPENNRSPTCAKCSKNHHTKNCNETSLRCANCVHFKESDVNHASFSQSCPSLDRAQKILMSKTNYDETKN